MAAVGLLRAKACATFSIIAFEMPIALTGYAALSVPRQTTLRTLLALLASMTFAEPSTLVRTASSGKNSQDGTCLSAAAWKTKSTPRVARSTLS